MNLEGAELDGSTRSSGHGRGGDTSVAVNALSATNAGDSLLSRSLSKTACIGEDGGTEQPADASAIASTMLDSILSENATRSIYVPKSLAVDVSRHFIMNHWRWTRASTPPLLCLAGPFGVGKSCILREICHRIGIDVCDLQASSFESRWAGEPAERIKAAYIAASERQMKMNVPMTLIVDDVDLALGHFDDFSSGTTNTPHAISALMEIADNPHSVGGQRTDRVPVLMTANDLSKIYGAIRRPGRLRAIRWDPGQEDVFRIARHILRDLLNEKELVALCHLTKTWKVAHYSQLKSLLLSMVVEKEFGSLPAKEAILQAMGGKCPTARLRPMIGHEILMAAIADMENGICTAETNYAQCSKRTSKRRRRRRSGNRRRRDNGNRNDNNNHAPASASGDAVAVRQ